LQQERNLKIQIKIIIIIIMKWRHNEVGVLWWCWDAKRRKENFKHLQNYAHETQLPKIKKRRLTNKL